MANPNSNSESTPLLDNGNNRNHQNSRRLSPKTARLVVKSLVILLCLATAATVVTVVFQEIKDSRERQGRKGRPYSAVLAKGKKGAVATENPICSEVGLDVLKDDGSAVDAAIASTLCVGVLNMFSSGIGGGGFMIVRSPTACPSSSSKSHCSEHTTIDFRETGPTGSNSTMFKGRPLAARVGGLAVGVPGELRGLEEAHKRWGVLPWERLVKPSIQIAKSSKTSKELERRLKLFGSFMLNDPDWKESFINKDTGSLLVEGDVLKREAYAKTLEKISKNGPGIFYEGEIAKSLVEKVQSKGGILTLKDLKDYKAKVSSALEGSFQGKKIWTTNAPTSGPVLLSLLNILEGFPNYFSKKDGLHSGLNNHLLIESMKFSSAQRTEIADPDFLSPLALKRISEISTKREADLKRSNISFDRTHGTDWYQPVYDVKENHGTMHLSVVDKNGMAVALTSTVNLIFGSQVLDPETGIILNDEMDDNSIPGVPNAFGLYPSPYNYPAEGKRPLSSMAPSILENSDGSFYLAIGGSGGSRIFPAIGSVLTNLEFGLDLSSAIERPRIHHQLLPPQAQIETGYDEDLIESLKSRGHEILMTDIDWALSEVQAVMKVGPGRKQVVYGASDSRKGGIASAY